ncbi:MAG: hypothetical protein SO016_08435 [Lachnospiraceae bacterium]|nr:hypothetical protein [Lachnospiraceae bacterium]
MLADKIALIDKNGNKVAEYTYDSWKVSVSISGSMAATLRKHGQVLLGHKQ